MQPWRHEYRVRSVAGEVRWLQGSSIPEQQKDGAILWHGFVTDITQERTAKTAKEELAEQFRHSQKVESIGRLAGGVAHDFNNLLTSVLGFTELALLELPEESSVRSHLEQVSESAQRGAELTQQLLAFGGALRDRAESG
jgi:two-component system, cell cycle sensor histidine kinase and response regulator CckA